MRPLNNRIIVKPDPKEKTTASGIVLPDSFKEEKPLTGTVVVSSFDEPKVGDRVLFSKFGYDEVEIDKEVFGVVSVPNILAIL